MENFLSKKILDSIKGYSDVAQFKALYEALYEFSQSRGYGDPHSYFRSAEILIADALGLEMASGNSGADAFEEPQGFGKRAGVEIKTTRSGGIKASYTGLSKQDSWPKMERYLVEEKIGCYENHYIGRFQAGKIAEVWKMSASNVLGLILPKVQANFYSQGEFFTNEKDPRPKAALGKREITAYATRVL